MLFRSVALTQDGYYNANAPTDQKTREYFIEGIDYLNSEINWAAAGVMDPPAADYQSSNYRTFGELTDLQRKAVLGKLGYIPLYDFSYSDARTVQILDGNATEFTWKPKWAENPLVIYTIDVSGWQGKAIRMPRGANEDVLRVVSQGAPVNRQELVGTYHDIADVTYTQDRTAFNATTYIDLVSGKPWQAKDKDASPSGSRWLVSYLANGEREFSIKDGRAAEDNKSIKVPRKPQWQLSVDSGTATFNTGIDKQGKPVSAPAGYLDSSQSVDLFATRNGEWVGGTWDESVWKKEGTKSVWFYQDIEIGRAHV